MDLRVLDVVFVISLTPKPFPRRRSRVNFSSFFSLDLTFLALINRFLALMTVCCTILDFFGPSYLSEQPAFGHDLLKLC